MQSVGAIVMRREYIFTWFLTWFFLLYFDNLYTTEETGYVYSKGCAHLRCESGGQCIKRRFWCKNPPCPGMLYCSKSRKESLKGPVTCDTVHCSRGHVCIIRVRGCRWDEKCKQQVARCISEKEYYEGAASCVGFECPSEKRCILRELHCINPPCKLIRSCADVEDVQAWFDTCKSLDCLSEYECFLRRPDNNCLHPSCTHAPDCLPTTKEELISESCHGWICPRMQKCVGRIVGTCKGFNCTVERSCRRYSIASSNLSADTLKNDKVAEQPSARKTLMQIETELIHQELERRRMNTQTSYPVMRIKPTLQATSTSKQNTRYTTPQQPANHRQIATTKSTLITESSSDGPYSTLPYPPFWSNHSKLFTSIAEKSNTLATASKFPDWSKNASFSVTSFPDIDSTAPRDTKRIEVLKKIYIATDDELSLPAVLEHINFIGQGYPIWIKNELHPSGDLGTKDENKGGWRYHTPREPYRILLPPYEPVILVGDTRLGQFSPFLTYAFDHPFNEAALIALPEITSRGTTGNSKTNNISAVDENGNHTDDSTTVKVEDFKTSHFDDSSGDYVNFPATKRVNQIPLNIHDKEIDYDDYEWRPWHVIHDYLKKGEPQSVHEQEFNPNIDKTDDSYRNDTAANTKQIVRNQGKNESVIRITETRYAHGQNEILTTFHPPSISMEQYDYSYRDEEYHDLTNYSDDTITVRHNHKSGGKYRRSTLSKILGIPSNETRQKPNILIAFSFDEFDKN